MNGLSQTFYCILLAPGTFSSIPVILLAPYYSNRPYNCLLDMCITNWLQAKLYTSVLLLSVSQLFLYWPCNIRLVRMKSKLFNFEAMVGEYIYLHTVSFISGRKYFDWFSFCKSYTFIVLFVFWGICLFINIQMYKDLYKSLKCTSDVCYWQMCC